MQVYKPKLSCQDLSALQTLDIENILSYELRSIYTVNDLPYFCAVCFSIF